MELIGCYNYVHKLFMTSIWCLRH